MQSGLHAISNIAWGQSLYFYIIYYIMYAARLRGSVSDLKEGIVDMIRVVYAIFFFPMTAAPVVAASGNDGAGGSTGPNHVDFLRRGSSRNRETVKISPGRRPHFFRFMIPSPTDFPRGNAVPV